MMNVLILSCGTRYKLVKYFTSNRNCVDKVVVTDCSKDAPALYVADKYYIVPRMDSPDYTDTLVDICKKENIDIIIPLHEDEIILIAKIRSIFEKIGVMVALSDYEKIKLCRDKLNLNNYLADAGIQSVPTYKAEDYCESSGDRINVFAKPRTGAGSVDTFHVHSKKLLEALIEEYNEQLIVQPDMSGREYGVDVYVDMMSNEIISCFCKEKLRMRAGETEKSVTDMNASVIELVSRAVKKIGLVGPLDVDVMEHNGQYSILEINPRFGGGYPHAYECGANFIELICTNASGHANEKINTEYKHRRVLKYSDVYVAD